MVFRSVGIVLIDMLKNYLYTVDIKVSEAIILFVGKQKKKKY